MFAWIILIIELCIYIFSKNIISQVIKVGVKYGDWGVGGPARPAGQDFVPHTTP